MSKNTTISIAQININIPNASFPPTLNPTAYLTPKIHEFNTPIIFFNKEKYHRDINGYKYNNMTIEERVEYYLTPKWYSYFTKAMESNNKSFDINLNVSLFYDGIERAIKTSTKYNRYFILSYKILDDCGLCGSYCKGTKHALSLPEITCKYHNSTNRYVIQFGDEPMKIEDYATRIPVFIKSRYVNEENAILLKLNSRKHFGFYSNVERYDISWEKKNNAVIWRGALTGGIANFRSRYFIVSKYFNYSKKNSIANGTISIDIAFNKNGQKYRRFNKQGIFVTNLTRNGMSVRDMLRSKYLVTIAGNDVATNFNWIMFSNSVPFVFRRSSENRKYEKEIWTMHGLLQPYIHYIPFTLVDDGDDSLIKAYEFCESHSENCSRIAQNGKQWMMQFRNKKREDKIIARMLTLYCNSLHIL